MITFTKFKVLRCRCPYCGEKTVVPRMQTRYGSSFKTIVPTSLTEYRCSNCKNQVYKTFHYKFRYLTCISNFPGITYFCLLLFCLPFSFIYNVFVACALLIILTNIWYITMYFCMHCDFLKISERRQRDNIIIEFANSVPLKKNTNEYICELKYKKLSNKEQTYIIFDDLYQEQEKRLKFCMVAGPTPHVEDQVEVVTNKGNVFLGKVVEVIPKTENYSNVTNLQKDNSKKQKKHKFLCPYCGNDAVINKMQTKPGLAYRLVDPALFTDIQCSDCGAEIYKKFNYKFYCLSCVTSHPFITWCVLLLMCVVFTCLCQTWLAFILMPVFLIVWYIVMYFCMHCDFFKSSDRKQRDNILIEFDSSVPFKKNTNEYVCELKYSKLSNKEKTYIIFDDTYKGVEKTLKFCIVTGQTPCLDDAVRVITKNGDTFDGRVIKVIPKTPAYPSIIPEQKVADTIPKKRKNWQDPDYFN